jgi:glycosyl transferase, family 25
MYPIYVVNLRKATDRREAFLKRAQQLGYDENRFTFYEAYDSHDPNNTSAIKRAIEHKTELMDDIFIATWRAQSGRLGAFGCSISITNVLLAIVKQNIPFACVMEDDAYLTQRLPDVQPADILQIQNQNVDVIHINDRNFCKPSSAPFFVCEQMQVSHCSPLYGTDGFFITNTGAKRLLECVYPMVAPIDTMMKYYTNGCRKGDGFENEIRTKDKYLPEQYKHKSKHHHLLVLKTTTDYVTHNDKAFSYITRPCIH